MGLLRTPLSLLLLLLREPACLRTEDHPAVQNPGNWKPAKLSSCPAVLEPQGVLGRKELQALKGSLDHRARWAPRASQEIQRTCSGARRVRQLPGARDLEPGGGRVLVDHQAWASPRAPVRGLKEQSGLLRWQWGRCQELLSRGATLSGWYHLCLPEGRALPVFCDMDTLGGGWLVFQRRQDGSVDFFRSWSSYKAGFGSQESEFWLGNENLHQLTLQGTWELRVELEDFDGNRTFAHYGSFRLLGESDHYQLVLGKFLEGTAGDSLSFHHGKRFSTFDADHDTMEGNCAGTVHGAWWYEACYQSNLNGPYAMSPTTAHMYGIDWASGLGVGHPYRRVRLMLR